MSENVQVYDGDWFRPTMRGFRMQCCDCGLVHRLEFAVIHHGRGHGVEILVKVDESATKKARKALAKAKR